MAQLTWDNAGERFYETGVKKGVLYVYDSEKKAYGKGVAWNGLVSVTESPSGAEANPLYADDVKYLNLISNEEFGGTIEAYQSPVEFDECDGTTSMVEGVTLGQQKRKMFGFCYRTARGNDTDGYDHDYKLHIIYGALAAPSERAYASVNDSPEAMTLSWEFTTTPVSVDYEDEVLKPTSHVIISGTSEALKSLEDILYGSDNAEPRLLLPGELISFADSLV